MKKDKLALFGGGKAVALDFPIYNAMGEEEVAAAAAVIRSGKLSGFLAGWGEKFEGGENVKLFENEWSKYFGIKHAISVNSWTSGLVASIGALDIEPGDEIRIL